MSEQFHNHEVSLQNLIEGNSNSHLRLPNREFSAPILITSPITIEGSPSATIWSMHGPAVQIQSDGVQFKNLRIEITNGSEQSEHADVAILTTASKQVSFENVEIRGRVIGIEGEEGQWIIPSHLNLGWIEPHKDLTFAMEIEVPCECSFTSEIFGCTVSTTKLLPGVNKVNFEIEALSRDILISGFFSIKTKCFTRKISLTGHSLSDFSPSDCVLTSSGSLIWTCQPTNQVEPQSVTPAIDDVVTLSTPPQDNGTSISSTEINDSEPLHPKLPPWEHSISLPNQSTPESINIPQPSSLPHTDSSPLSVPNRERRITSQPKDFHPNSPFSQPIQSNKDSIQPTQGNTQNPNNIQSSQDNKVESNSVRETKSRTNVPIVFGPDSPFSIPNQVNPINPEVNTPLTQSGADNADSVHSKNPNQAETNQSSPNNQNSSNRKVKNSPRELPDIFKKND